MDVAGYEGLTFVGSGGNAHVYRATNQETGDIVAIKVLRGAGDEAVTRRFERESHMMSELEKFSNVVPVHESGFNNAGDPYLVMPLYLGGSLQQRVDDGPMEWREAVEYVHKVAGAIALAHAKRILHLDLKPANILLDDDGEPWLADFGISQMMGSTGSMSSKMLTPSYTPPERLDGEDATETTDIYGLGATLFALLAGKAPYVNIKRMSPVAIMMAVVNDPIPVHELPGDVPGALRNLLLGSMAKRVEDRPSSAIEFVSLLEEALAGNPIDAPTASRRAGDVKTPLAAAAAAAKEASLSIPRDAMFPAEPTAEKAFPSADDDQPVAVPPALIEEERPIRMPLLLAAAAVVFLLLAGTGAFVLSSGGDDEVATSADAAELDATEAPNSNDEVLEETNEVDEDDDAAPAEVDESSNVAEASVDGDDPDDDAVPSADVTADPESAVAGVSVVDEPEEAAAQPDAVTPAPAEPAAESDAAPTTTVPATTEADTGTTEAPRSTIPESTTPPTTTTPTTTPPTTTTAAPTTTAPAVPLVASFIGSPGPAGDEQTWTFRNTTSGDPLAYQWDFGDGETSPAISPFHTYETPGVYTVTLVSFGPEGQRDETTRTVSVTENSSAAPTTTTTTPSESTQVSAGFIAAAGPVGSEQTLSFQNTSSDNAVAFEWDFGDGESSTAFAPSHAYETPGNYSVTVTAIAADGSQSSATNPVRVDPNTPTDAPSSLAPATEAPTTSTASAASAASAVPLEAGFIAMAGPTENEQTLSFQNITKGDAVSYVWDFGDGGTSTAPTPSHTYDRAGRYYVTVTATAADGTTNSATHPVRVSSNT